MAFSGMPLPPHLPWAPVVMPRGRSVAQPPKRQCVCLKFPCKRMSRWKLGSMVRINGLFHLLINGVYCGL